MTHSGLMTHKEIFVEHFLEKWFSSESLGGNQPQEEAGVTQAEQRNVKKLGPW